MQSGKIHSYLTLSAIDGPGLRCVVFMQGCPMRCKYCHNPDTWETERGQLYSSEEMVAEIIKHRNFYDMSGGGVTFSGGEPTFQTDFLEELLTRCHENGLHTAVDTSGCIDLSSRSALVAATDLFILDIKMMDQDGYRDLTGGLLQTTLDNARLFSRLHKKMWIRYVLVPGYTDTPHHVEALGEFIGSLNDVEKVIIAPYSRLGVQKWEQLGIPYQLDDVPLPDDSILQETKNILKRFHENVIIQ